MMEQPVLHAEILLSVCDIRYFFTSFRTKAERAGI